MTTGLDDAMYRLTVEQRDAAWREADAWKQRYEMLLKTMADITHLTHNPPMKMLAHAESYEAGRMMERERAAKVCERAGIDGLGTLAAAALIRKGDAQ